MKNSIHIIAQAFYGNRTGTEIGTDDIDRFILGHLSSDYPVTYLIDRTLLPLPGTGYILV